MKKIIPIFIAGCMIFLLGSFLMYLEAKKSSYKRFKEN